MKRISCALKKHVHKHSFIYEYFKAKTCIQELEVANDWQYESVTKINCIYVCCMINLQVEVTSYLHQWLHLLKCTFNTDSLL